MFKKIQIVVFRLGKELYGVDIASVQEIVRVPDITTVPEAPDFLEGVINLRGRILPVIDLRKLLGLAVAMRDKGNRVLVLENEGKAIGLLVDEASEVMRISGEEVEAPPEMISAIGVDYITGVAKMNGRLIILLNLKKTLSVEDMKKMEVMHRKLSSGELPVLPKVPDSELPAESAAALL